MKPSVVIIGGGLAGLTAAHYLNKSSKFEITLLEKNDRLGGRILSFEYNGKNYDHGGFMIMPFYKHLMRLVNDLGLQSQLIKMHNFNDSFYNFEKKDFENPKSPYSEILKILFYFLKKKLQWKINLYEPDLDLEKDKSAEEFYAQLLGSNSVIKKYNDILLTSYTYASFRNTPASLLLPFILAFSPHYFNNTRLLSGNTQEIAHRIGEELGRSQSKIMLGSGVVTIDEDRAITLESGEVKQADYVCIASTVETFFSQILEIPVQLDYTNHSSVFVITKQVLKIKHKTDWTVCYVPLQNEYAQGIVSIYNLHNQENNLYQIFFNHQKELNTEDLESKISQQLETLFGFKVSFEIISKYHWKKTMPLQSVDLIRGIREVQGKNNVYFAGDYLGSMPIMENAVYWGEKIASKIISKHI